MFQHPAGWTGKASVMLILAWQDSAAQPDAECLASVVSNDNNKQGWLPDFGTPQIPRTTTFSWLPDG